MKYKETYEFGCLKLKAADISDYKLDARLLLEFVCHTSSSDLFAHGDKELNPSEESLYLSLIEKRKEHVPLQHLTHSQDFMGLSFYVDENVLIPRADTETLVEEVLKDTHDGMRILDMCTGSGCILLSLLHYTNDCEGVGADISLKALEVAKKNSKLLNINAEFIESNLFSNLQGKFDILVSNPPYIKSSEIPGLMPEVKDHDPLIALDGFEDGLYFYKEILKSAGPFLNRGALVAFEIGNDQGDSVSSLMKESGFIEVEVINDYCGNQRVVKGYYKGIQP